MIPFVDTYKSVSVTSGLTVRSHQFRISIVVGIFLHSVSIDIDEQGFWLLVHRLPIQLRVACDNL